MGRVYGFRFVFAFALVAAACSSSSTSNNGPVESPPVVTTGDDASAEDGGEVLADAGRDSATDATTDDDLLGTLSGSCGVAKTLLGSPDPALEVNKLVFVASEKYERASLSTGGQRLYDTANAGGSSGESEVMSFEVLRHCEGASLLKTETEVKYDDTYDGGPKTITDILVQIGSKKVGVSVTRAYKPSSQPLTDAYVKELLEKKLDGIVHSSARVLPEDKWVKQILHVFTANSAATDAVVRVYPTIAAGLRGDTIVYVTETKGGGFVYCNPDPALGSECP